MKDKKQKESFVQHISSGRIYKILAEKYNGEVIIVGIGGDSEVKTTDSHQINSFFRRMQ